MEPVQCTIIHTIYLQNMLNFKIFFYHCKTIVLPAFDLKFQVITSDTTFSGQISLLYVCVFLCAILR